MRKTGVLLQSCSRERRTFFIHWPYCLFLRHCVLPGPPSSLLKWGWLTGWQMKRHDFRAPVCVSRKNIRKKMGFSLVLPPGLWSTYFLRVGPEQAWARRSQDNKVTMFRTKFTYAVSLKGTFSLAASAKCRVPQPCFTQCISGRWMLYQTVACCCLDV